MFAPKNIEFLFAGDSHGFRDLNNGTLDNNSYNISQLSDNLKDIYCKLTYLTNNKIRIKYLILQVDPHLYANYRIYRNNNELIINYLNYDSYNKFNKVSLLEYYILKNPIALQKNRNFIFKKSVKKIFGLFKSSSSSNLISKNVSFKNKNILTKNRNALKRITYHYSNGILDDNEIKKYFYKIIELAKLNNIKVVGIKYPVSKYYNDQLKNSKYNKCIVEISSFIDKKINNILDYKKLYYFNDDYFSDSDHLNHNASLLFTNILNKELEKIYLDNY